MIQRVTDADNLLMAWDGLDQIRAVQTINGSEIYYYDHNGSRVLALSEEDEMSTPADANKPDELIQKNEFGSLSECIQDSGCYNEFTAAFTGLEAAAALADKLPFKVLGTASSFLSLGFGIHKTATSDSAEEASEGVLDTFWAAAGIAGPLAPVGWVGSAANQAGQLIGDIKVGDQDVTGHVADFIGVLVENSEYIPVTTGSGFFQLADHLINGDNR